jgi:hypothetical protein
MLGFGDGTGGADMQIYCLSDTYYGKFQDQQPCAVMTWNALQQM